MTPKEKAAEILSIMDKAAAFYLVNQIFYEINMCGGWLISDRELYWHEVDKIIKAS